METKIYYVLCKCFLFEQIKRIQKFVRLSWNLPEDSQSTKLINCVKDFLFWNWSPTMASDVKCFGIIHITKLDRKTVKQPIGIPKNLHSALKMNL